MFCEDNKTMLHIIIQFPHNARCDWLQQRALSENRARVDDVKLAFKCSEFLTNLTQIKVLLRPKINSTFSLCFKTV